MGCSYRYPYDSANNFSRIMLLYLYDSAVGRILDFFMLYSAKGRIKQSNKIAFG
jgi:hypothetical protein